MPPASPVPGWSSGGGCTGRVATRRGRSLVHGLTLSTAIILNDLFLSHPPRTLLHHVDAPSPPPRGARAPAARGGLRAPLADRARDHDGADVRAERHGVQRLVR